MNHLLTFIFLIFIFYFYWLIGEFVADCFAIKIKIQLHMLYMDLYLYFYFFYHRFSVSIISIELECLFYFILCSFLFFFVFLLWRKYKNISTFVNEFKSSLKKENIIDHVKNNWVIYIFVFYSLYFQYQM